LSYRNLPASACDEPAAELPANWRYSRLANLLAEDTRNGYSRKPDDAADGTPILRISAGTVRRDGIVAEEEHKLISGIEPDVRLQYGLKAGDLLACRFNGNKAFVGRFSAGRSPREGGGGMTLPIAAAEQILRRRFLANPQRRPRNM
jgi:hypothetical protein